MNGHDAEEFRFVPVQVYLLELVYLVVGESEIAVPDDGLGLGPALDVLDDKEVAVEHNGKHTSVEALISSF